MTTETDLSPCPSGCTETSIGHNGADCVYVECSCGWVVTHDITDPDAFQKVVIKWNTRATPESASGDERDGALELVNHLLEGLGKYANDPDYTGGYLLKVSDLKLIRSALTKSEQQKTAEPDNTQAIDDIRFIRKALTKQWINKMEREFVEETHLRIHRIEAHLTAISTQPKPSQDAGELEKVITALEIAIGYPAMVSNGIGKMPVLKHRAEDDCRIIGEAINTLNAHLESLMGSK